MVVDDRASLEVSEVFDEEVIVLAIKGLIWLKVSLMPADARTGARRELSLEVRRQKVCIYCRWVHFFAESDKVHLSELVNSWVNSRNIRLFSSVYSKALVVFLHTDECELL